MARVANLKVALASCVGFICIQTQSAALLRAHASPSAYTFEEFTRNFGRAYVPGTEEHNHRLGLFQAAVSEVQATNARNVREGRLWKAGVHPFMDWTEAERKTLNGYKPSRAKGKRPSGALSLLHSGMRAFSHSNATRSDVDVLGDASQGGLSPQEGPQMRNQGNCGSCWAISAVEAVEAQLQRSGVGRDVKVSAQALLDCVPNPHHCGGSGGCDGATGELAYAYIRDNGIPLETDLPYSAQTGQCQQQATSSRVRVSGWNALPSNQAKPLMQAIVSEGPVVVAVDANNWFNYESGVFDGCDKDADLGHAVLAKGFGDNFWLIQNSWGQQWGEQGHIRLFRHADEDSYCGTDHSPKDGVGCDGGPPEVTVCGSCGILYDPLVPQGVHIESGDAAVAAPAKGIELEMDSLLKSN